VSKKAESIKKQLASLRQRAAAEGRDSDDFDLALIMGHFNDLSDTMTGMQMRIDVLMDQRDAAANELERLIEAVEELDEHHPLVEVMLHTVREREWAQMRGDGMLTAADMVEQFQQLFGDAISRDDAVVFTQWITGLRDDIREDAKRLLAHSIRSFLDGLDGVE